MNPRYIIVGSFAVSLGVIVYSEIRTCKDAPWPPRIIGAGIVFGLLDLFSLLSEELASIMAVGIVLGLIVTKAFRTPNCEHSCATAQPASYKNLQNSPTPQQGTILA